MGSPCLLKNWLLFCLSFAAIFLFTVDATIPVWLRLLCRLISCCLCYAAILYFWTASRCATHPLWLRLLYKFYIVLACFACFISAAKLIAELILEPDAACAVLLGYLVAAVGVAVGVAPRHATDLSPCLLKHWLLFCLSFAAIFLFTVIFPDLATIPVWLRLLCRPINCCLCCAAILYFWTASRCAADPLWLRLLYKFNIVELFFAHFISAAKLITEAILEPEAACAVLLGVFIGLNLIFCCLRDRKGWLPTSCLKAESTAAETKTPVVTVAVRH